MNKKIYMVGVMSLALMTGGAQAFANGGYGKMMRHGGGEGVTGNFFMKAHCVLHASDKLALTAAQEKTIRDLKMDVKKTVIRQRAEGQIFDLDIRSAMKQDKVDAAALQTLVDQKYESEKVQAKAIASAYVTLRETLTEEQWKTLTALKKEKMEKRNQAGAETHKAYR